MIDTCSVCLWPASQPGRSGGQRKEEQRGCVEAQGSACACSVRQIEEMPPSASPSRACPAATCHRGVTKAYEKHDEECTLLLPGETIQRRGRKPLRRVLELCFSVVLGRRHHPQSAIVCPQPPSRHFGRAVWVVYFLCIFIANGGAFFVVPFWSTALRGRGRRAEESAPGSPPAWRRRGRPGAIATVV